MAMLILKDLLVAGTTDLTVLYLSFAADQIDKLASIRNVSISNQATILHSSTQTDNWIPTHLQPEFQRIPLLILQKLLDKFHQ